MVSKHSETDDILGMPGYYLGLICPCALIVGAVIVLYVVMCQCLYPLILAIMSWSTGKEYVYQTKSTFSTFSQSYCGFIMFPILVLITMKKDLTIFMKVGSFGVIFILFLIFFIITVGIESFGNTDFSIGTAEESNNTDWLGDQRTLVTFNLNFAPLAGNLCTGFFLHTCSLSVLRSSKNPEKTHRDLFYGYLLVFFSYASVGLFGYFGFIGTNFTQYFVNEEGTPLAG